MIIMFSVVMKTDVEFWEICVANHVDIISEGEQYLHPVKQGFSIALSVANGII